MQLFSNNSSGRLAAGISDTDLVVQLESGQGASFPDPDFAGAGEYCICTIEDESGNVEIVRMVDRSTDLVTLDQRGLEGTSALAFIAGSRFEIRLTAGLISKFVQSDNPIFQADLEVGGNDLNNCGNIEAATISGSPTITGGRLRAPDNGTANEISVPDAGDDPLIGVNKIFHEGNPPTAAEVGAAPVSHTHDGADITSGEVDSDHIPNMAVSVADRRKVMSLPRKNVTDVAYNILADDLFTKLRVNPTGDDAVYTLDTSDAVNGDLLFFSLTSVSQTLRVNLVGGNFLMAEGITSDYFELRKRFGVIGIHKVGDFNWEVTGDYEL